MMSQFKNSIKIFSRFSLVGMLSTLIHISVVWIILMLSGIHPLIANLFAFLTAFIFSFLGHYFFSFKKEVKLKKDKSKIAFKRALIRFSIIAFSAFFINSVMLYFLLQLSYLEPLFATVISIFIIPIITFLASLFWGFKSNS